MERELAQLERTVATLTEWKQSRMRERFKYPLGAISKKVIEKTDIYMPIFTGNTYPATANLTSETLFFGSFFTINNQERIVYTAAPHKQFTADTSDVLTNTNGQHNLQNGEVVVFATTDTLPAPLSLSTAYYVVERTGNTFKVSATLGGSAINITDTGIGTHYYAKL